MKNLLARWMSCLLTPDNKRNCETNSQQCLPPFKRNPKELLLRFVAVEETSIHWYTTETKQHLKQWTSQSELTPNKDTILSAGEMMTIVF